jgi:hypothetical protein
MSGRVLSLLSPAEVEALRGLPAEAIAGTVADDGIDVEAFRPNPQFVEFLHRVIRAAGPGDPDLQRAARDQQDGWVYVIDLRTPAGSQGPVPPEDIIGGFRVETGHIIAGSYWANDAHRVFTANGLVRLPPSLRAALVAQLPEALRCRLCGEPFESNGGYGGAGMCRACAH